MAIFQDLSTRLLLPDSPSQIVMEVRQETRLISLQPSWPRAGREKFSTVMNLIRSIFDSSLSSGIIVERMPL